MCMGTGPLIYVRVLNKSSHFGEGTFRDNMSLADMVMVCEFKQLEVVIKYCLCPKIIVQQTFWDITLTGSRTIILGQRELIAEGLGFLALLW